MTADAAGGWIDEAVYRLGRHGYREISTETLGGYGTMRALRRADFRMSWLFTRLHTFVILRAVTTATAHDIVAFTRDTVGWAKNVKGGMPNGLQTGVAVLAVTVANRSDPEAAYQAHRSVNTTWAGIGLPVLVDVDKREAHTRSSGLSLGSIYQGFLGEQQRVVIGDLDCPTMKWFLGQAQRRRGSPKPFGPVFRSWARASLKHAVYYGLPVFAVGLAVGWIIVLVSAAKDYHDFVEFALAMPFFLVGAAPFLGWAYPALRADWAESSWLHGWRCEVPLFLISLVWLLSWLVVAVLAAEFVS